MESRTVRLRAAATPGRCTHTHGDGRNTKQTYRQGKPRQRALLAAAAYENTAIASLLACSILPSVPYSYCTRLLLFLAFPCMTMTVVATPFLFLFRHTRGGSETKQQQQRQRRRDTTPTRHFLCRGSRPDGLVQSVLYLHGSTHGQRRPAANPRPTGATGAKVGRSARREKVGRLRRPADGRREDADRWVSLL